MSGQLTLEIGGVELAATIPQLDEPEAPFGHCYRCRKPLGSTYHEIPPWSGSALRVRVHPGDCPARSRRRTAGR